MIGFCEWLLLEAKAPWEDGKPILTWGDENPKTAKNTKPHLVNPETGKGFYTALLHLSPANESGFQCCAWHSTGCAQSCLHYSGDPQRMKTKLTGRFRKTLFLAKRPDAFLRKLYQELAVFKAQADADNKHLAVRMNATSDVPWEAPKYTIQDEDNKIIAKQVMHHFPDIFFYDYTKSTARMDRFLKKRRDLSYSHWPTNYHLTYSRSEHHASPRQADEFLERGGNVSVVFNLFRRHPLPTVWLTSSGRKFPIVDGDQHDLRFLDKHPAVVGLRAKGDAIWDTSGFVVQPEDEHLQTDENYDWIAKAIQWRINRRQNYLDNRKRTIRQNKKKRSLGDPPVLIPGGPGYHRRRAMRMRKAHQSERERLMQQYTDYMQENPSREGLPTADDENIPYRRVSLPLTGEHMDFKSFIENDDEFPIQPNFPGMEYMTKDDDVKEIHIDDMGGGMQDWDMFHGRRGKHSQVRARHLAKLMNKSRLNPGREYAIVFKPEPGGSGGGYWIVSRKRQ